MPLTGQLGLDGQGAKLCAGPPSLGSLLLQTAPKIFGGPIKTHLLVFTDAKGADGELDGVKEVAKEIKGKLLAVTVASSNDRVLNYFGIEKSA